MSAPGMVAVPVEGWTLFRQGEGYLVRDLDLAAQAEMADPHKVRSIIRKAADDGAFVIVEPATIPPGERNGAYAVAVPEVVQIGSGAHRDVTAYYLNREAALHIVMRLRTPKAVALQVAIVKVFLRAVEGPPMDPALVSKASGKPLTKRQAEILEYMRAHARTFGSPPTMREIGAHFGLSSTNAVNDHLLSLERKGAIRLRPGKSRGVIFVDLPAVPEAPPPAPPMPPPAADRIDRLERLVEQLVGAVAMLASVRPSARKRLPAAESYPLPFDPPKG